MVNSHELESKVKGYLWGAACGDALGMPVEFSSLAEIKSRYGEKGLQELNSNSPWTDDTQMIIALVKALNRGAELDTQELMDIISQEFIDWLDDTGIAPGNTCIHGVSNLKNGIHWSESGVAHSKGCGSLMRCGIIGAVYHNDINKLIEISSLSGSITHGHPTAKAASIAGSYAVKLAIDGVEPVDMFKPLLSVTEGISSEFTESLNNAFDLASSKICDEEGLKLLGKGWIAEEAFAMSYFCILRYPNDFKKAVQIAVNIDGDSDSVGCVVGGILGARLGFEKIPSEWKDNLLEKDKMEKLAKEVVVKVHYLDNLA